MKTDSYFQNFVDSDNVPKIYKLDSAPTLKETFITISTNQRIQRTDWANYTAIFSVYGTDWAEMNEVADQLRRFIKTIDLLNLGDFTVSEAIDPVRERNVLNIGASFGGVLQ